MPPSHAALFTGQAALLESHRGWDRGALEVASSVANTLDSPLFSSIYTRLLVDLNRSIGHRQLFSEFTRSLPRAQREQILQRYYRPYREQVEAAVAEQIDSGQRVLHIGSHSFTPRLENQPEERRADVAWLYDPQRPGERAFAAQWKKTLSEQQPRLRLRRNYPYRGHCDGLTKTLRERHADADYLGIELEVNQRLYDAGGAKWRDLKKALAVSLAQALQEAGTEV